MLKKLLILLAFITYQNIATAQADNEIQVYASPITEKSVTFFELHSNYTFSGPKNLADPTQARFLNEALEITHGFGHNFELGFYTFTALTPDGKYQYLGTHIRPRYTAPEKWKLPFGASLSAEFGFFRTNASNPFYWEGEIRPVIDKTWGNFYIAFNPDIGFILTGADKQWNINPQLKATYTTIQQIGLGIEYYSTVASFSEWFPFPQQEHLIGPAVDLYMLKNWEFNAGFLFGLNDNSNQRILKIILGRRVERKKNQK